MTASLITIDVGTYGDEASLERDFTSLNHRYGTNFTLHRFRRPVRRSDGTWDCTYQLPVLVYRYGDLEREHGIPDYRMFNLATMRANLADDMFPSYTRLDARISTDDPRDRSAANLTIADLDWVLGLDDARKGRLLTELDADEPIVEGLYAAVEHKTGLVYPMAIGTTMSVTRERSDDDPTHWTLEIKVSRPLADVSHSETCVYDTYFNDDRPSDRDILDRLEHDCDCLRNALLARSARQQQVVTRAATKLVNEHEHCQDSEE